MRLLPLLAVLALGCVASSDASLEERIERLVREGRVALDERRPAEAQELFEEAARLDDSLRTKVWVLRAWMDQGRNNDTLREIDALVKQGNEGADIDYLYGMAFVRRGHEHLAEGMNDESVQINFQDACDLLAKALDADPERYRDAWLSWARAAWELGRNEEARGAVEKSLEVAPEAPGAWLLAGRIARAQLLEDPTAQGDADPATWSPAARAHAERGLRCYRRAVELCGRPAGEGPDDVWRRRLLVAAASELGALLVRERHLDEATEAYGLSVGWDGGGADLAGIRARLVPSGSASPEAEARFRRVLAIAREVRSGRAEGGKGDAQEDAVLDWWTGWSAWATGALDEAEQAFRASVAARPDYASAWYYVARIRDARGDVEGAVKALRTAWETDPAAILPLVRGDARATARIDAWIAELAEDRRWVDAAVLGEVLAEAAREDPRHWNNLGYFLREAGRQAATPELAEPAFEASLRAYRRAIALAPDDPQLVNDAAVVLETDLKRDLPLALEMYERAAALAARKLTEGPLSPEERARFVEAGENARRNLERLRTSLDAAPGDPPPGSAGD